VGIRITPGQKHLSLFLRSKPGVWAYWKHRLMPLAALVLYRRLAKLSDKIVLLHFHVLVSYQPEHVYLYLIHSPPKDKILTVTFLELAIISICPVFYCKTSLPGKISVQCYTTHVVLVSTVGHPTASSSTRNCYMFYHVFNNLAPIHTLHTNCGSYNHTMPHHHHCQFLHIVRYDIVPPSQ